jgi:hypothetical protein
MRPQSAPDSDIIAPEILRFPSVWIDAYRRKRSNRTVRTNRTILVALALLLTEMRVVDGAQRRGYSKRLIHGNHEAINRLVLDESVHNLRDVGDRNAPVKKVIGFD